jgi:hypothetical protein
VAVRMPSLSVIVMSIPLSASAVLTRFARE